MRLNLIAAIVCFCAGLVSASAKTIDVCLQCPMQSISQAIAIAQDDDTIRLSRGVYPTENVIVEKKIHLIGSEGTVLDGGGLTILYVHHDSVTIENISFQNVATNYIEDRASIKCNNSDYVHFENLKITDSFFGIIMEKSDHGHISNCTIKGNATPETYLESSNGNALHLWYCKDVTLSDNTVLNHRDGIYFEFVEGSQILRNHSEGNMRYGLHFMFSHDNTYENNRFEKNGAGVAVMYSDHVIMRRNVFKDNWGTSAYGLLLKDITDSDLEENRFENNTIAISADNSSRINMVNNAFVKNGYALRIMGNCADNQITKNDFISNTFDVTTNSSTSLNSFEGNFWEEYAGYDLNRDGIGDVPFRPVKLFTYIIAQSSASIILMRSMFIDLLNLAEKVTPVITPETLIDNQPRMRPINDLSHLGT